MDPNASKPSNSSPPEGSRNIALVAAGAAVSTFGTGLYAVGVVLFIAERFDSPALVSAFNFLAFAPAALLARPIGRLVDRRSKRGLIVGSDLARGALMLAFAGWVGVVSTPHPVVILAFGLFAGLGQAVFVPSVHALMPELVSERTLPRANAVRASSSQLSNALGMGSAGFLVGLLGLPALLLANGVSFLVSAVPEAALRPRAAGTGGLPHATLPRGGGLRRDRRLLSLVLVNAMMYGLSAPIVVTIPFMMRETQTQAGTFTTSGLTGLVFAAMVIGGLLGFALASSLARRARREAEMIRVAILAGAAALGLVALSPGRATLFVAAPLFGATAAVVHVGVITLLQRTTAAEGRGRVFAALEAFGAAAAPTGYLVSGLLGSLLLEQLELVYAILAVAVLLVFVATFSALKSPAQGTST